METFGNTIFPKFKCYFKCDICNIETCSKKDYTKHLLTRKHIKASISCEIGEKSVEKPPLYTCSNCSKTYSSRSGLWKHHKLCKIGAINTYKAIINDSITVADKSESYSNDIRRFLAEPSFNKVVF